MTTPRIFLIIFLLFFSIQSCDDFSLNMDLEVGGHLTDEKIVIDSGSLNRMAGQVLNKWYLTCHEYTGPGAMMQTMADISTCSWGMSGVNDMSHEPRSAWNNKPSYAYSSSTNRYFNKLYELLTDANLLVKSANTNENSLESDLRILIGKVGQAFSVGYLSLVFDRVWISDENGMVSENPVDYKQGMNWALQKLDEAIELAVNKDLSIPEEWLPGGGGDNQKFIAFLNSIGARMLVGNVRNTNQKNELDWERVLAYTNKGVKEDFTIFMDDVSWYASVPQTYLVYPGWARVDMRVVNMMDPKTPDYWPTDSTHLPESHSADARLLSDYQYLERQDFNPTRGTYHFSSYRYAALDEYIHERIMDLVEFSVSENDMYKAEALLNLDRVDEAAAVINAGTRTARGNLPPVEVDPEKVYQAIHYERMVEFAYTTFGIGFFEMRKEDLLQEGTPLHFPVPGAALELIPEENYTFGGTEGKPGEDYSIGGWR